MHDPTDTPTSVVPHFQDDGSQFELIPDKGDAPASGTVLAKLADAVTPGFQAEFDPAEADAAGAFEEDALSEADALDGAHGDPRFVVVPSPPQS